VPDEHSLFSASGSDGWIYCHGKLLMETGRRKTSDYADEGTAAHTLADWVLKRRLAGESVSAQAYVGRKIRVERDDNEPNVFTVDTEFADYVDSYVNGFLIATNGRKALRFCEQRVYYNEALGVPKALAFGTGDGFGILLDAPAIEWPEDSGVFFPAGVEAQVHDLKFGRGVRVEADGAQMKHYALGLLQDFDLVADITRVRMTIHQPRLDHTDEVVMSVEDLKKWAELPRTAAQSIMKLMARPELQPPKTGWQDVEDVPAALVPHLKPTDKGCRFCDAKAICPALLADVAEAVTGGRSSASDFKAVGKPKLEVDAPADVHDYGDNWLAVFASRLDQIDTLVKAVRAEIDRRVLNQGKKVPGFKIVKGKQGDRSWTDKGQAEAALKNLGLGNAAYKRTLVTPTQFGKLVVPDTYDTVAHLITRAEGRPAVVHESDPRPAYDGHTAKASDFKPVEAAEGASAFSPVNAHPFR
jgi:hypothetical protein